MVWYTQAKRSTFDRNICSMMESKLSMLDLPPTPPKIEQEKQQQHQQKTFKDLLKSYWLKYCENSTIHGVRYIYDPSLRGVERFIWSGLVMTCVILTCFSYLILTERYSAKKLQTVVANSQFPVFRIPFPAVGVCTNNRLNWEKFEQAKAAFLPPSADEARVKVFTDFVERMETLRFGHFDAFKNMEDVNLELLDDIDVTKLAEFMTIRCEDIFVNGSCLWRKMAFDCCAGFVLENTEYGYCLVFNSQMSKESQSIQKILGKQFYPYHNSRAGEDSGLNFRLQVYSKYKRPHSQAENSVTILIKRPEQLTDAGYTITPKTTTFFIVRPQITNSDDDLHAVAVSKRNCYFEDESYLLKYQSNLKEVCLLRNCLNKCHEEYMLRYCNCTVPLFFLATPDKSENCTASRFRCLAKNNDIFSSDKRQEEDSYFSSANPGMTCSCLIPCNVVEYFTSLTTLPLQPGIPTDAHSDIYNVDVHYQSDVFIQYRTSLEFTVIDLIANFGGIFGLCLGASLVSAVELIYYTTFGFGLYLYDNDYFEVFKTNLRNLKQKCTVGLKDSFMEKSHEDVVRVSANQLKRHALHKQNRW